MGLTQVEKEGIETLINNNADNRVVTGSGTANTLEGEANLTWDGSVFRAKNTTNAGDGVVYVEGGEGANAVIEMVADEGDDDADKWLMKATNGGGWHLQNKSSGAWVNNIVCATGNSVNMYYNGSSKAETINTGLYVKGALRIGADNAANEMDDYEEGTFDPQFTSGTGGGSLTNSSNYANQTGHYVKVGNMVTIQIDIKCASSGTGSISGQLRISNLPFGNGGNAGVAVGFGLSQNLSNTHPNAAYMFGGGGTDLWLQERTPDVGEDPCEANQVTDNTRIVCGVTYRTT